MLDKAEQGQILLLSSPPGEGSGDALAPEVEHDTESRCWQEVEGILQK